MKKSLLKGMLLLSSSLLLVACSTDNKKEEATTTTKTTEVATTEESSAESTEDTTVEGSEDIVSDGDSVSFTTEYESLEDGKSKITVLSEQADERGWLIQHIVVVDADGKVLESDFDYINEDGGLKTEDEEYVANMKEKDGTDLTKVIDELNKYFVKEGNIDSYLEDTADVVSGATTTSNDFYTTAYIVLLEIDNIKTLAEVEAANQEALTETEGETTTSEDN